MLEIIYIIAIGTEFSLKLIPRPNILLKMYFDHKSGPAAWKRWPQNSHFRSLEGGGILTSVYG